MADHETALDAQASSHVDVSDDSPATVPLESQQADSSTHDTSKLSVLASVAPEAPAVDAAAATPNDNNATNDDAITTNSIPASEAEDLSSPSNNIDSKPPAVSESEKTLTPTADDPSEQLATVSITSSDAPLPTTTIEQETIDCTKTSIRTEPAQRVMQNLLGSKLKCTLDDGRTVTGNFLCMDRLKNIIMSNATEERQTDPAIYCRDSKTLGEETITVTRHLSQAMIPGKHLVKVEVDQPTHDLHVKPIMNSKS